MSNTNNIPEPVRRALYLRDAITRTLEKYRTMNEWQLIGDGEFPSGTLFKYIKELDEILHDNNNRQYFGGMESAYPWNDFWDVAVKAREFTKNAKKLLAQKLTLGKALEVMLVCQNGLSPEDARLVVMTFAAEQNIDLTILSHRAGNPDTVNDPYLKNSEYLIYPNIAIRLRDNDYLNKCKESAAQQGATDKPAGCIDVNGKRIDVAKCLAYVKAKRLFTNNGKLFYEFCVTGNESGKPLFDLVFYRDRDFLKLRHVCSAEYLEEAFKACVKDMLKYGSDYGAETEEDIYDNDSIVLDNVDGIIWDINSVSHATPASQTIPQQTAPVGNNRRTINDLTEDEKLISLDFSGDTVNNPTKSFGGLPFVSCYGLTREKLTDILVAQVEKHKDWIAKHGGERVKIDVTVNLNTCNTKWERYEILNSVYGFQGIESKLNALLSKATPQIIPAVQRPVAPQPMQMTAPQLTATGRFLDRNNKLVGLVLSDGSQRKLDECIKLAKAGKIKNIKAIIRTGVKPYLQGNGISLEALPSKHI